MQDLKKEIKKFFKGEIKEDGATLEAFSHDASFFEIRPELVVAPKTVADIKNLVKFVSQKKQAGEQISLTARSGGTDMTGGPLSQSIVVSFTEHLNKIKKIGKNYALAEPGVFYRDFEKETLKHNLLLPSYPASREICAVGGMVANNSGGEKNLVYGKTERYVKEIKMVLRDGEEYIFKSLSFDEARTKMIEPTVEGEIYQKMFELIDKNYDLLAKAKPRVSKNSAGYYLWNVMDKKKETFDLSKMIVGSQGTLGMITEFKLGLVTPQPHSRLLIMFLRDMDILAELVNEVLKHSPESFESYDDHTFKLLFKLFPEIAKRLGRNMISVGLQFLPEVWMAISGGIPKLVLLAEFTGETDAEAAKAAHEAEAAVKHFKIKTKVTKSDEEAGKYWVMRRESFNLLRHHVHGLRTAPFIDDFIVRPDQLSEFLPKLSKVLDKYKMTYTIAGHAGDANFHIIPLLDLSKPGIKDMIIKLADEVYTLVLSYGGSITGEHNDGLIRTPYLEKMYGLEVYKLFEQTKQIFDPDNIFNPGKKVGGSIEESFSHLNTKM